MALNEIPRVGKTVRYGVATESVYGTEDTANGGANVVELTIDDVNIDPGLNVQDFRTSHGSNQPIYEESIRNTSGSAPTFTLTGPLNTHYIGIFAGAFYQTGTWAAETFVGPFTPYAEGSHPDFDGDQKAFTFYKKDSATGRDGIVTGCICTSFKVSCEKKGVYMFEANVQGKTYTANQTLVGTWVTSGSVGDNYGRVHFEDCTYKLDVGAGNVNVAAQSFEVSNGYDAVTQEQSDGAGAYDAIGIAGINGSFTINTLKDVTNATNEGRMLTDNPVTLTIAGAISLVCTGKTDSASDERDGLAKVATSATMMASDETADMVTITFS